MRNQGSFIRQWGLKAYYWAAELLYHPFAWTYDFVAWLVSFGYWSRWRLDALHYLTAGTILEIGFGTGELLIEMTSRGYDVVGLELSPQMHRVTGHKLRRVGHEVKRLRGRAEAIPLPSGFFNNVVSTFPSNYILHDDTLQEIYRVLGEDGRLVIVGMGVQYTDGLRRWLTGWIFAGNQEAWIEYFLKKVEKFGYKSTVIEHKHQAYSLPVLILECDHEQ